MIYEYGMMMNKISCNTMIFPLDRVSRQFVIEGPKSLWKKAVLETGVPDLDNFSIFCWKRVYGNVRRGICYYTGGFTATRLQLQTEGVKPAGLSVRSCIWQNGDIQGSCSQGRWDRCSPPRAGSTTPSRFILQPAALGFQGRSSAWLGGVYDKLVRQIHKSLPYMLCTRIL